MFDILIRCKSCTMLPSSSSSNVFRSPLLSRLLSSPRQNLRFGRYARCIRSLSTNPTAGKQTDTSESEPLQNREEENPFLQLVQSGKHDDITPIADGKRGESSHFSMGRKETAERWNAKPLPLKYSTVKGRRKSLRELKRRQKSQNSRWTSSKSPLCRYPY